MQVAMGVDRDKKNVFPCEWRGTIRNIYRHTASKYWLFAPGLASDRDLNCASIVLQLLPLWLWSQSGPGPRTLRDRRTRQLEIVTGMKNCYIWKTYKSNNEHVQVSHRHSIDALFEGSSSVSRLPKKKSWLWYKTNCKNNHCAQHKTLSRLGNGLYHGGFMKPTRLIINCGHWNKKQSHT